jgi:hypothetical protein
MGFAIITYQTVEMVYSLGKFVLMYFNIDSIFFSFKYDIINMMGSYSLSSFVTGALFQTLISFYFCESRIKNAILQILVQNLNVSSLLDLLICVSMVFDFFRSFLTLSKDLFIWCFEFMCKTIEFVKICRQIFKKHKKSSKESSGEKEKG